MTRELVEAIARAMQMVDLFVFALWSILVGG